jgi:CHASE3 domain sensor protein
MNVMCSSVACTVVALALICVGMALSIRQTESYSQHSVSVEHHESIKDEANNLVNGVLDTMATQRGFLLAPDDRDKKMILAAIEKENEAMVRFKYLIRNDPDGVAHEADRLMLDVDAEMDHLSHQRAVYRSSGIAPAVASMTGMEQRNRVDNIRRTHAELLVIAQRQISRDREILRGSRVPTIVYAAILSMGVLMALGSAVGFALGHKQRARARDDASHILEEARSLGKLKSRFLACVSHGKHSFLLGAAG